MARREGKMAEYLNVTSIYLANSHDLYLLGKKYSQNTFYISVLFPRQQ